MEGPNAIKSLTVEEIHKGFLNHLTVGDLKEILYALPASVKDAKIVVERVTDSYYTSGSWATLKQKSWVDPHQHDEFTPAWCASFNEKENLLYIFLHY